MTVRGLVREWGWLVLAVVFAGLVLVSIGSGDRSVQPVDGPVFAHVDGKGPQMFLREWAVRNGSGIDAPVSFRSSYSWGEVTDMVLTREEDVTMGFIPFSAVPAAVEQDPDLRLLRYRYVDPGYVFKIAVRNDSVVYHPSQLRGRRIGAGIGLYGSMMALTALDEAYGLNTSNMEVLSIDFSVLPRLLMSESLDAAVATTSGRPGFRSVFDPVSFFMDRYGAKPFFTVFAVSDPSGCAVARDVVGQYRNATQDAARNVSAVIQAYERETGINRSEMFRRNAESILDEGTVAPIGDAEINATAAMWEYAYRNGFIRDRYGIRDVFDRAGCS